MAKLKIGESYSDISIRCSCCGEHYCYEQWLDCTEEMLKEKVYKRKGQLIVFRNLCFNYKCINFNRE